MTFTSAVSPASQGKKFGKFICVHSHLHSWITFFVNGTTGPYHFGLSHGRPVFIMIAKYTACHSCSPYKSISFSLFHIFHSFKVCVLKSTNTLKDHVKNDTSSCSQCTISTFIYQQVSRFKITGCYSVSSVSSTQGVKWLDEDVITLKINYDMRYHDQNWLVLYDMT